MPKSSGTILIPQEHKLGLQKSESSRDPIIKETDPVFMKQKHKNLPPSVAAEVRLSIDNSGNCTRFHQCSHAIAGLRQVQISATTGRPDKAPPNPCKAGGQSPQARDKGKKERTQAKGEHRHEKPSGRAGRGLPDLTAAICGSRKLTQACREDDRPFRLVSFEPPQERTAEAKATPLCHLWAT